jgi:hypothetical protein
MQLFVLLSIICGIVEAMPHTNTEPKKPDENGTGVPPTSTLTEYANAKGAKGGKDNNVTPASGDNEKKHKHKKDATKGAKGAKGQHSPTAPTTNTNTGTGTGTGTNTIQGTGQTGNGYPTQASVQTQGQVGTSIQTPSVPYAPATLTANGSNAYTPSNVQYSTTTATTPPVDPNIVVTTQAPVAVRANFPALAAAGTVTKAALALTPATKQ